MEIQNRQHSILAKVFVISAVVLSAALMPRAMQVVRWVLDIIMPILLGLAIAYIVNIPISFLERHFPFQKKPFGQKLCRPVCCTMGILFVLLLLALISALILPQLIASMKLLIENVPVLVQQILDDPTLGGKIPPDIAEKISSIDWEATFSSLAAYLHGGAGNLTSVASSLLSPIVSGVMTAFFGVIFSMYFTSGKSKLIGQVKTVVRLCLPDKWQASLRHVFLTANKFFRSYVTGQFTEAVILGSLCALGMLLLKLPYAGMIGALVGFTALIPVIGAYIGAIIGFVVICAASPVQAVIFLIFLIVLQLLENSLIFPKVVGKSVELPGVFVFAAVTVFSAIAGIAGILIGVPLTATGYHLFQEHLHKKALDQAGVQLKQQMAGTPAGE